MTTHALVYEGRDLPPRVQRAIARALDPALPVSLTAAERVALAALLRRVEAVDGMRQFWVRRCNMGELFGRVERTISNWLTSLEAKGLIAKEQGRTRWGNFSCVTLTLTEAAARLLGLHVDDTTMLPRTADRKKTSSGHKETERDKEQSLSERHPAAPGLAKGSSSKSRIPADLQLLTELQVSTAGIFKLMKVASQHGKRLSSILVARGDAVRASRNVFAFVRKLASDAIDYEAVARHERETREETDERSRTEHRATQVRDLIKYRWVQLTPDTKVFMNGEFPEMHRLADGVWRYVGVIAGTGLVSFLDRVGRTILSSAEGAGPDVFPRFVDV